ncbi:MAG: zinc ABC transporter substrate-binding protein [Pseudomonadota bacterium]
MMHRRAFFASTLALALAGATGIPAAASDDGPISVVATFSVLGDMVARIGGANVSVTTLVAADGDAHVYRPTPADARAVKGADLLVFNGLGFEGWLERLIDASDFSGERLIATRGIEPIGFDEDDDDDHDDHAGEEGHAEHAKDEHAKDEHAKDEHAKDEHANEEHANEEHGHDASADAGGDDHDDHADKDEEAHADADHHGHHHGAIDPHAWQSLGNAVVYAENIAAALSRMAPEHTATFEANRDAYIAEIRALDGEIRALFAGLPEGRRTIVTSHDAFQYFARSYDLTFLSPQGLSTESEASAKDVASLIRQIRAEGITAVFVENIADTRLLKQIAAETGAQIGGTLYPDALSGPDGPASTYLDMIRHNAQTLVKALAV